MTEATPKKLVLSLIRGINETKTTIQTLDGELGAEIKNAAENKDIHPGALKLVARLVRMNGDKSAAFMDAFRVYAEYADEAGLFGDRHVGDLLDEAPVESNVRELRRGPAVAEAPADVA